MNKVFFSLLIFLLFLTDFSYSQKESDYWFFGNGGGINFSSGKPTRLNKGELYTEEGCATASDNKGKLLFYTDGISVYNKNHERMQNGFDLRGGVSSTQSAIVVPNPANPKQYYVFTVGEKANQEGLSYSIVDMSLNNGKGDITVKNKKLLSPTAEKLTAVKHRNGTDTWVITHKWSSDAFYAYLITAEGINEPIISKTGTIYGDTLNGKKNKQSEAIGYLKPSNDGRKIAAAICYKPNNDVELFDFNNLSGAISNPKNIPTEGFAYGLSFSPDNSKLYVSFLKGKSGIIQYDLQAADIGKSGVEIIANQQNKNITFGALQMGPDGRMYVAKTDRALDCIENPNGAGKNCNYVANAVELGSKASMYGLPYTIFGTPMEHRNMLGKDTSICSNGYTLNAGGDIKSVYLWSTGETTQNINATASGSYWVQFRENKNSAPVADTVRVTIEKSSLSLNLNDTTVICVANMILNAGNPGAKYLWNTGDVTQTITVKSTGFYSVIVSNGKCAVKDSCKAVLITPPSEFKHLVEFNPEQTFLNKVFEYTIYNTTEFELQVFDKKDNLVFETKSTAEKWDGKKSNGKKAPAGTYKWIAKYKSKCTGSKVIEEQGTVKMARGKTEQ